MNTDELSSLLYDVPKTSLVHYDLRVAKNWCVSPKFGGYGLPKALFLAFVMIKWEQAKYRKDKEFYIRSSEWADLLGIKVHTVLEYSKFFADLGFFTLSKRSIPEIKMTNLLFYKPTEKIPEVPKKDFWRIPVKLILPKNDFGLGVVGGTILSILLQYAAHFSNTGIKISNKKLASSMGVKRNEIISKLAILKSLGLVEKGHVGCDINMARVVNFLKFINSML